MEEGARRVETVKGRWWRPIWAWRKRMGSYWRTRVSNWN